MKLVFNPSGIYKRKFKGHKVYWPDICYESYPDALAVINDIEKEHPFEYARIDIEGEDTCALNFGSIVLKKEEGKWTHEDCVSGYGVLSGIKFSTINSPDWIFKTVKRNKESD